MPDMKETKLLYDGAVGQLYKLWFINLLLKIVTLGIYGFWGKTRLRRYTVHSYKLEGDRFHYTGTGKELLLGFLRALPIIAVAYAPFVIWNPQEYPAVNLMYIPIAYLIYAAIYSGMRYRYRRTTWRGIRGNVGGSALVYGALGCLRIVITVVSLTFLSPIGDVLLHGYRIRHLKFGQTQAEFHGRFQDLMANSVVTTLLLIPTLGLSSFWYHAALERYLHQSTTLNGLQFKSLTTGRRKLNLVLGNSLLLLLSLGLAAPIVIQRSMRYLERNFVILGDIETSGIIQSTGKDGTTGEGVDGILGDTDIGLL